MTRSVEVIASEMSGVPGSRTAPYVGRDISANAGSTPVAGQHRDRCAYMQQWRMNRKAAMTDEHYARNAERQRDWRAANPGPARAIYKRNYTKRWLLWLLAELRAEFSSEKAAHS